jgi:catechol 2,3-dioxygenase-like lactoylglutathione lyase family enzyme
MAVGIYVRFATRPASDLATRRPRNHFLSMRSADAPLVLRGLDHLVLRARDPVRLAAFYCQALGCTVDRLQDGLGLTQLRAGAALIDIVDVKGELGRAGGSAPGPEGHNLDHFCLKVDPFDGPAIRQHLLDSGFAPGDVVQRFGADGEGPSIYVKDPEGNTVELKGPGANHASTRSADRD